MQPDHADVARMREALALAETAIGVSDPNPRVGCVIARGDGTTISIGATQRAGGPHAEMVALREARAHGFDTRGATAWVTLEPCAHHGRTPPCCDALIAAGLRRVVVAVVDPYPVVAGAGIARMRAAGLQVDMADAAAANAAWQLNIGFFSRVLRQRPWVRVKVAASLDGRTGLDNGVSQWITSVAARTDGHAWRKRASAILTGVGTVLADDPRLDVRFVATEMQPLRVVVDSSLRTPPSASLLAQPGRALLATTPGANSNCAKALRSTGAEVLQLPSRDGRVDLAILLKELSRREVNEVHVEGGPQLTTALLESELVDEILLYMAPRLLGGQRGIVAWPKLESLAQGTELEMLDVHRVGTDLRLRMRPTYTPVFGPTWPASAPSKIFTVR